MKKFIIIIAAVLLHSTFADAQVVIRKNTEKNTSTVSTTVVTRNIIYKERPKFDAKVGYQQFVELGSRFCFSDDGDYGNYRGGTGVDYIGGWRFNNWFFAGIGIGINYSHAVTKGIAEHVGTSVTLYDETSYWYYSDVCEQLGINSHESERGGAISLTNIPIYVHLRGYYMRTKWAPYSSMSLGGELATKDCGFYLDFSTGVDVRLNEKYHAYASLGFCLRKYRDSYLDHHDYRNLGYSDYTYYREGKNCGDNNCPYKNRNYDHYHIMIDNLWFQKLNYMGMSFRIGVSF